METVDVKHQVITTLYRIDSLLAEYLTENTMDDFNEIPEVDEAREIINELIDDIQKIAF